ncbi:hypothetical protein QTP88_000668 [Uroleucon formosanum]
MSMRIETSIENLIEVIEKRPALYKKQLKEYSDINLKKKLWEEVCEVVIPDWNELGAQEKTKQVSVNFTPKNYYFYFLVWKIGERKVTWNQMILMKTKTINDTGPTTSTPIPHRKKRTNVSKPDELDEALIKALNQPVDEDTNFALSLVPSLQKLNAEEKLDAKIGILNIFKQISLARRFETSSQSTSSYNVLQRPLSYPVYHPGSNIMPPPQLSQHSNYTSSFTTPHSLPTFQGIQNTPSPENSNNTEIYDL